MGMGFRGAATRPLSRQSSFSEEVGGLAELPSRAAAAKRGSIVSGNGTGTGTGTETGSLGDAPPALALGHLSRQGSLDDVTGNLSPASDSRRTSLL